MRRAVIVVEVTQFSGGDRIMVSLIDGPGASVLAVVEPRQQPLYAVLLAALDAQGPVR